MLIFDLFDDRSFVPGREQLRLLPGLVWNAFQNC